VFIGGPSGSGKSLLLRAIADLDPHQGEVYLDDLACSQIGAPEWRRKVGLLPAESQWWYDRVGEHFASTPDSESLAAMGFTTTFLDYQVSRLSTGERQRLALLRLLVQQPAVLLLDEPTSSLDSTNTRKIEGMIESYRTQHNAAVIWVSHDDDQVARVTGRRYVINEGQLQRMDPQ
jgi:ABC-type iron transport system FetAB ATPase subunit